MSNRKSPNWPALLQDGGWRELKRKPGVYWPVYRRVKNRQKQEVRLLCGSWTLFRDGHPCGASSSLDNALYAAEVSNVAT